MEIPIQVAVQCYQGFPNDPSCVRTIPQYVDDNANSLSLAPSNLPPTIGGQSGVVEVSPISTDNNTESRTYSIQHALPFGCSQEYIYRKTVYPLIAMFLEGYDASIVMYGQHGTGKTYTLYGPGFDCIYGESAQGIVQRSVRDMFTQLMKRQRDFRYAINVAWIEICGNEIHDIIGGHDHPRPVQCMNVSDVFQCIQIGMQNRSSESSHNLFTITLEQQWINSDGLIQHRLSTVSFCDLCGTERYFIDELNLNQQISIPKDIGLQTLERIVSIICDPNYNMLDNSHINLMNHYDETTLTKLLKDSFGGRAQTLLILCLSPLEQDIDETIQNLEFAYKIQLVRNHVVLNTFSDNNLPVTNFIIPSQQLPLQQIIPQMTTHQLSQHHQNISILDKLQNSTNIQQTLNNSSFGIKFAASQWIKLISNAEGLFNKLLTNDKNLNEQDRECIEEWMYLKQECDDCLSSSEMINSQQRLLGPIQEADEPDETADETDLRKSRYQCNDSTELTENESDSEDIIQQTEYLEEGLIELCEKFTIDVNLLIEQKYDCFIEIFPKAITSSYDGKLEQQNFSHNRIQLDQMQPTIKTQRSTSVALPAITNEHNDNDMDHGAEFNKNGRRRSIQPGGSNSDALMLSSADIKHLQQIASNSLRDSQSLNLNNSVCREAVDFLENSNDMHPLRAANATKAQEALQNNILCIKASKQSNEKEQRELEHKISITKQMIDDLIKNKDSWEIAKKRLQQDREKLELDKKRLQKQLKSNIDIKHKTSIEYQIIELDKRLSNVCRVKEIVSIPDKIKSYQQSIKDYEEKLTKLKTDLRKERRKLEILEERLKYEKTKDSKKNEITRKTVAAAANVNTRITQLDYVLKEKSHNLKLNSGEDAKEQSIRHEIRNLRSERNRLVEERCSINRRLKNDKTLLGTEVRQIIECDVAIDVIDSAIEFKNEMICGRHINVDPKIDQQINADLINPDFSGRRLMSQLNRLNEKEMRTLLYKFMQKVIDLRESTRQLEIQALQHETERNQWQLRECIYHNAIRESRYEGERDALNLQRQQEATLTFLLKIAAEDNSYLTQNSTSHLMPSTRNNLLQMRHHHRHPYVEAANQLYHRRHNEPLLLGTDTSAMTVATATSSNRHNTDIDSYQKNKVNKNFISKFFRNTYGNGTNPNHSQTADKRNLHQNSSVVLAAESKVTRTKKKIIIQQNK